MWKVGVILLCVGVLAEGDGSVCGQIKGKTALSGDLLKLDGFYKFNMEVSSATEEVKLTEAYDSESKKLVVTQTTQKDYKKWISDANGVLNIVGEKDCKVTAKGVYEGTPLGFSLGDFGLESVQSMRGLLQFFQNASNPSAFPSSSIIINETFHDHGIPNTKHWAACKQVGTQTIEVVVCYPDASKTDFKFQDPNGAKFPVRVTLASYAAAATKPTKELTFEVFSESTVETADVKEGLLLPQPGVYCQGKVTPIPLDKKANFTADIVYVDVFKNYVDNIQLSYDAGNRLVRFTFTYDDRFLWVAQGLGNLTLGTRYTVVHDFSYGYQYLITEPKGTCAPVEAIPTTSGDTVFINNTYSDLKSPLDILLHNAFNPDALNFSIVGNRTLSNGMTAEVYSVRVNKDAAKPDEEFSVYEAYFSSGDWAKHNFIRLIFYQHTNKGKGAYQKIIQDFNALAYYGPKDPLPFENFCIEPCLTFNNDSYLFFTITNTLTALEKIGLKPIEGQLRSWIATTASISPLKIGQFFWRDMDVATMVFFTIAEEEKLAPAKLANPKVGSNVTVASLALNATLQKDFVIPGLIPKLTIQGKSMRCVPKEFHPSAGGGGGTTIVKKGYTSGSMAALAICMLLIGGVLGLVVAFFMWKRNRGIAYQVYE